MGEITFLTSNQVGRDNQLEVLKKRGTKATLTDYAITQAGGFDYFGYHIPLHEYGHRLYSYVDYEHSLFGRTGPYWLSNKTMNIDETMGIINHKGTVDAAKTKSKSIGIRPVVPYNDLEDVPTQYKIEKDGVTELEYGHYPQMAVSQKMQKKLRKLYLSKKLLPTGHYYTMCSIETDILNDNKEEFKREIYEEYEYKGKRYIKASLRPGDFPLSLESLVLSNKKEYSWLDNWSVGEPWIEVQPIEWLLDQETGLMISKKILLSGIQFQSENYPEVESYENSFIKEYMDRCFYVEMLQNVRTQPKQENNRRNKFLEGLKIKASDMRSSLPKKIHSDKDKSSKKDNDKTR